jgi:hypothetical protein
MARDAQGLYLYSLEEHGDPIPPALSLDTMRADPGNFVSLIDIDMLACCLKHDNRAVRGRSRFPHG